MPCLWAGHSARAVARVDTCARLYSPLEYSHEYAHGYSPLILCLAAIRTRRQLRGAYSCTPTALCSHLREVDLPYLTTDVIAVAAPYHWR